MSSVFRAHFRYEISPLLFSYYRLENIPESEWDEYIVDQNQFNKILAGNSSVKARREVGNKLRFYQHCINNKLPIVPVYCVFSDSQDLTVDGVERVSNLNKWQEILSRLPKELFIKPVLGRSGMGSFAVVRENDLLHFSGRIGSVEDLYRYLMERVKSGQSFIIQPRLRTYSSLMGIVSSKGLSTVRIITIMGNNKPQIIMSCFKMVRGNNEHDNFLKGLSNNLIVPINIDTGELKQAWGSLRSDWPQMIQYASHPDTGKQIEGVILPFWHEICELALRAQKSVPLLPTIGWDIALTDDGVLIVEANTAYGVAAFQLFEGRGLKSEFERLLK